MNKLFAIAFGIGLICTTGAQAGGWYPAQPGIIPVAGGCGIGVHRGPYNGCDFVYGGYRHAYYRGYRDGYYDGSYDALSYGYSPSYLVDQGACSGLKPYLICAPGGPCWADCYGRVEFGW